MFVVSRLKHSSRIQKKKHGKKALLPSNRLIVHLLYSYHFANSNKQHCPNFFAKKCSETHLPFSTSHFMYLEDDPVLQVAAAQKNVYQVLQSHIQVLTVIKMALIVQLKTYNPAITPNVPSTWE